MNKVDVAIIGAGVVGLAIAWKIASKTGKTVVVIERNNKYGQEISSRNSEVIHSGLYYSPSMLKTQLCVRGNSLLYEFCEQRNVAHYRRGKILVALNQGEEEQLDALYNNALSNTVSVNRLTGRKVLEMEPEVLAYSGLYFPNTGTVDVHELMQALFFEGRQAGVVYLFYSIVKEAVYTGSGYEIGTQRETIHAQNVINCAGLGAETIAQLIGIDTIKSGYHLHPCKGDYFKIKRKLKIQHLVYSVPTSNSLGIHLSMDREGYLRLGPNAYYVEDLNYSVNESHGTEFFQAARQYIPSLKMEDLMPDFAGIRPKIQGPGEEMKDFVIKDESDPGYPGWINLIGIESPGLTSCLAIGDYVKELI
ncbi:NAD(P)/FAD-dependent oxidoreductase [Syntrophomonas wolfei]|uniref:FAD dependent oxidoreductase n=1 Tax=Syntrophomonas wolfei subsp. wolfei (strain DSM 2245B / Goettingen) TaxID=335541 RepID=Q0AZ22_SYNWW|nr:NAD(P)/FAD-dependent oxidoreductase [Syntrophomonas wolfei]ABI68032.1 FAD dependent oxidoreductase [Syntrophomonas wolfei subsp. wolfei str. Goettingen G311]